MLNGTHADLYVLSANMNHNNHTQLTFRPGVNKSFSQGTLSAIYEYATFLLSQCDQVFALRPGVVSTMVKKTILARPSYNYNPVS
jgi:hypothetical protein